VACKVERTPVLSVASLTRDQDSYPLPTKEMVLQADWPKRKSILGRGLLALQIKCGAEDLADGAKATVANITSKEHPREYHHLFPVSLLEDAEIPDEQVFRALNCALVTWRTNRTISKPDRVSEGARGQQRSWGRGTAPASEDAPHPVRSIGGWLRRHVRQRACEGKALELSQLFDDAN